MARFDCFVIFAEMRTGSNALQEALNLYEGLTCYGEVFNPGFIGKEGQLSLFGQDLAARQRDPLALLERMKHETSGVPGFRFFHAHEPRVLEAVLPDPRCAKIMLTRDPLDAFVSRKIAETTGQWKLTDPAHRKQARVTFDGAAYEQARDRQQAFRAQLTRALQTTGQTAFWIDFDDIGDVAVLNGVAQFLGSPERRKTVATKLIRQNPEPLVDKVANPEALAPYLGAGRAVAKARPVGAAVRTWVAGREAPLLYLALKGGPHARVEAWLAALDHCAPDALKRDMTRKDIRQWRNRTKQSRAFAVVSHPLERAYRVFCRHILGTGPGTFSAIRQTMVREHDAPLPEGPPGAEWDARAQQAAFLSFLHFAKRNLDGQTGVRSDPAWIAQTTLLAAVSEVLIPDAVLREAELPDQLAPLARRAGLEGEIPALSAAEPAPHRINLSEVYSDEIEEAIRALHGADYRAFGFRRWRPSA